MRGERSRDRVAGRFFWWSIIQFAEWQWRLLNEKIKARTA
jgi:hypothetical protein